eukprot:COSAG02_NODE_44_length_45948_cov_81.673493_14_plen_81_part_00
MGIEDERPVHRSPRVRGTRGQRAAGCTGHWSAEQGLLRCGTVSGDSSSGGSGGGGGGGGSGGGRQDGCVVRWQPQRRRTS